MSKPPTILQRCLFRKLVPIRTPDRPGRNKPCPCQSGKKFKHCCKDIPTLCDTLKALIAGDEEEESTFTPTGNALTDLEQPETD